MIFYRFNGRQNKINLDEASYDKWVRWLGGYYMRNGAAQSLTVVKRKLRYCFSFTCKF